jgi:hypothetical protein
MELQLSLFLCTNTYYLKPEMAKTVINCFNVFLQNTANSQTRPRTLYK